MYKEGRGKRTEEEHPANEVVVDERGEPPPDEEVVHLMVYVCVDVDVIFVVG